VKISFTVEQDPLLVRGCDEPVIAGDITKFRSCSGWTTEIDLDKTLRDMLDWWRGQLASASTVGQIALDSQRPELRA
jgi:GDP-4-dehydro-6-deoxy-D-mannose reductase